MTTVRRGATKSRISASDYYTRPTPFLWTFFDSSPTASTGKVTSVAVYGIILSIQHLLVADTRSQGFRVRGGRL
jgi:hypothetical protein